MNLDATRQWVRKADDDLEAGRLLMRSERPINWVVCFHMQQCVEKYLKAFLVFHGREHPRTHNIPALVTLCAEIDRSFNDLKDWGVRRLTRYATVLRYGEESYIPDRGEAEQAVELAGRVRAFVREKLARANMTFEEQ